MPNPPQYPRSKPQAAPQYIHAAAPCTPPSRHPPPRPHFPAANRCRPGRSRSRPPPPAQIRIAGSAPSSTSTAPASSPSSFADSSVAAPPAGTHPSPRERSGPPPALAGYAPSPPTAHPRRTPPPQSVSHPPPARLAPRPAPPPASPGPSTRPPQSPTRNLGLNLSLADLVDYLHQLRFLAGMLSALKSFARVTHRPNLPARAGLTRLRQAVRFKIPIAF